MKKKPLGRTGVLVSELCLGTMTFGTQTNEIDAHKQLDLALASGINFIDTAEMYPVNPISKETIGKTEEFIGRWNILNAGRRSDYILATKHSGEGLKHVRNGVPISGDTIEKTIEDSLKRLQTDYIDLYQLHWPERNTNFFGKLGYEHNENEAWEENFQEVLETLSDFIKEGKIRQVGLSNETPYGVMRFLEESRKHDLPKMITVQNPYNLLNRKDEVGLTEVLHRENVGLFPYSPLGMGTLSGKHLDGIEPNSRLGLFSQYKRYSGEVAVKATRAYSEIAKKHNLNFAQMSLAFVNTRPFVTSNIIGATSLKQLEENIGSIDIELSKEVLEEINKVHETYPNPAP